MVGREGPVVSDRAFVRLGGYPGCTRRGASRQACHAGSTCRRLASAFPIADLPGARCCCPQSSNGAIAVNAPFVVNCSEHAARSVLPLTTTPSRSRFRAQNRACRQRSFSLRELQQHDSVGRHPGGILAAGLAEIRVRPKVTHFPRSLDAEFAPEYAHLGRSVAAVEQAQPLGRRRPAASTTPRGRRS